MSFDNKVINSCHDLLILSIKIDVIYHYFVAPKNIELIKKEKLKEIQDYIEKIYDISKISNISEEEIKELFKMIFEGDF